MLERSLRNRCRPTRSFFAPFLPFLSLICLVKSLTIVLHPPRFSRWDNKSPNQWKIFQPDLGFVGPAFLLFPRHAENRPLPVVIKIGVVQSPKIPPIFSLSLPLFAFRGFQRSLRLLLRLGPPLSLNWHITFLLLVPERPSFSHHPLFNWIPLDVFFPSVWTTTSSSCPFYLDF